MHNPASFPPLDTSRSVLKDTRLVPGLFDDLSRTGGMLFSDDSSVPCGLMFQATDQPILFSSASSKVRDLYTAMDAFHALGQGPAPRALNAPDVHVAHDTRDPAHPPFFKIPASLGFASILSVPIPLGEHGRAAMAFYAHPAGFFTTNKQHTAAVFAEQTRRSIHLALELARARNLTEHLQTAMRSRSPIDQAIGIIMAQNRCSQDQAFDVLKRASNTRNIKLRDLAASIVEHTSGTPHHLHFDP